jgi:hypothetical protein
MMIMACAPGVTFRPISRGCRFIAPVLAQGITSAAPLSRAGQTAPKMQAFVCRWSRCVRGRLPFFARTRVSVPFWPARASLYNRRSGLRPTAPSRLSRSSWNRSSTGFPLACSGSTSRTLAAKFFNNLPRLCIPIGMRRPHGNAHKTKAVENFPNVLGSSRRASPKRSFAAPPLSARDIQRQTPVR